MKQKISYIKRVIMRLSIQSKMEHYVLVTGCCDAIVDNQTARSVTKYRITIEEERQCQGNSKIDVEQWKLRQLKQNETLHWR